MLPKQHVFLNNSQSGSDLLFVNLSFSTIMNYPIHESLVIKHYLSLHL